MLDEVAAALAAIHGEGVFATELRCAADDLSLRIEGVGRIRFPISPATARKLCAVARAAPFGRRERTLHDTRVRNTWEIDARRVTIDARTWGPTLDAQLPIIRRRLGLPNGTRIEARLDKLLIYEAGQFFAPHQDSERADDMVASLVVGLPSAQRGGAIVVQHHGEKKVFQGAGRRPTNLSLLAFYADCRHEVKPVESGYRVSLTYQLFQRGVAKGNGRLARNRLSAADRLATSVQAYFSTPVKIPYGNSAPQPPDRLLYLLDHEYTQKGLSWSRLKNADRVRALALRGVAERLGCEIYLALADVHESWSCEENDDWGYGDRWRYRERDDEDDEELDEMDAAGPELLEIIDSEVELRHWIGANGHAAHGISASLSHGEICYTRPSFEMDPFRSEHEPYMGNYGNTVDRWYHRAAIVIWPGERDFAVRAQESASWAVTELARCLDAGGTEEALDKARQLRSFWSRVATHESSAAFIGQLLAVLVSLGDADLALDLLSPLGPHRLTARTTPALVALVERHGLAWSQGLFTAWHEKRRMRDAAWLPRLPRLCVALASGGSHGKALASWLLAREAELFKADLATEIEAAEALLPDRRASRADDYWPLVETAVAIGARSVRDDLRAFLMDPGTALPALAAGALLERGRKGRTPGELRVLGLEPLYRHVVAWLERFLATPARSPDDWSIALPLGCVCALCDELAVFLRNRRKVQYEWPLAKDRRRHVHGVIDRHRLPVTHATIRRGSPQTLVLTKQKDLFRRDASLRARHRAMLTWLRRQERAFAASS